MGLAVAGALVAWTHGLRVLAACRPDGPLFDHAVLLADMLHDPPYLFRGHNEHLPVMPRLVFQLEAWLTDGTTWVGVTAAMAALLGGVGAVTQAWKGRGYLVLALVLGAGLMRPTLAWALSWPTNVQYPLSLLGACVAAVGVRQQRMWVCSIGALFAGLSSAEGWLVLPLLALFSAWQGHRLRTLGWLLLTALVAAVVSAADTAHTAIQLPSSAVELDQFTSFMASLVAFPWSLRLGLVVLGPLLVWVVWRAWRHRDELDVGLCFVGLFGAGFAALVVVGRWWLPHVAHRYALGPTIALVGALGAAMALRRGLVPSAQWALVYLALVLAVEASWLGPDVVDECVSKTPDGAAFWAGDSDDGTRAHPGYDPAIALELRTHLWEWGLYRPAQPR